MVFYALSQKMQLDVDMSPPANGITLRLGFQTWNSASPDLLYICF